MAEALYPKDPPPSYESQFHYHTNPSIGMNASPAPSAPPLHYSHSDRPRGATNNAATSLPVATPRRGYKTVSLQASQEKEDLSRSPLRRVPKRAPPPPPMLNRSTSQPNSKSRSTRPSSSIQLGGFSHPRDANGVAEVNFRSHHSGNTSASTHPEYIQGQQTHSLSAQPPHLYETLEPLHHSEGPYTRVRPASCTSNPHGSGILRQTSAPSVVRRYRQVTLLPQDSDQQQPQPSQAYQLPHECQATINNNIQSSPQAYQSPHERQATINSIQSSPQTYQSPHKCQATIQSSPQTYQSPHECQATINSIQSSPQTYQSPHECQATINSIQSSPQTYQSPHECQGAINNSSQAYQSPHECQGAVNIVHTSPNTEMQTLHALQQQQVSHDVQTDDDNTTQMMTQHTPCSHHLPISSQSQALEVVAGTRPKPKPRNTSLPTTEQAALTQSFPAPMNSMSGILPGNQFTQHNAQQQFSVAQNIGSFPQLQTYSYAQQASILTMPGLMQSSGGVPMQLPLQVPGPGVSMQPPAPLQDPGVLVQTPQGVQLSPTLLGYPSSFSSAQHNVPLAAPQAKGSGVDELNTGVVGQAQTPRNHSETHPPLLYEQAQGPSRGSPVRQPVSHPPLQDEQAQGPSRGSPVRQPVSHPPLLDEQAQGPSRGSPVRQPVSHPPLQDEQAQGPSRGSPVRQPVSHPPLPDEQAQGPSRGSPVRQPVPKPRKGKGKVSAETDTHIGREGTGSAQVPAQVPAHVPARDGVEASLSGVNPDENQETGYAGSLDSTSEDVEQAALMDSIVSPQSDAEEDPEAPAKPPRRYVRKPAPPPPANRLSDHITTGPPPPKASPLPATLPEGATSLPEGSTVRSNTGSLRPESDTSLPASLSGNATPPSEPSPLDTRVPATCSRQPTTPSGYKITDVFFSGNIIYLLSLSDPLRLPLRASGSKLKGKSTFKNDCKFEIVFLSSAIGHEQTVLVVMLKCFSRINRYLAINRKGKVQITKGSAEKCKFVVREVTERPLLRYGVVTLESAIYPGWFISVSSSGKTRRCKETRLPTKIDESRFALRIERIFNPYSSALMNFDRHSVMHQLRDRSVIQLQLRDSSQFLCVDIKGRLMNTGNKGEVTTQFVVIDRGMGVVSLRSNKFPKVWLCVKQSKVQGNERPNLSADFCISESPDGSVQFESIVSPGIYLSSPCETRARDLQVSKEFFIKNVTPHRVQ